MLDVEVTIETVHKMFGRIFKDTTMQLKPLQEERHEIHLKKPKNITGNKETEQKYAFTGNIRVPHANTPQSVHIQSVITFQNDADGIDSIIDYEGTAVLDAWDLAEGIFLSNGVIGLACRNGKAAVRLTGQLRLIGNKNVEIGGALDTEIVYDTEEPDRMYIGTLVKDAYLNIGKDIRLFGATIRFELCTQPHDTAKPLPYRIDEMDEYLFQCTETIHLGAMRIIGTVDEPVTMSISIDALHADSVRTSITTYPALLRAPVLGEQNDLFISGPLGQGPFAINATGKWSATVCSRPHLQLFDPSDPSGPLLLEGGSFFTGNLEGCGFSSARLSISSELTRASAFPRSKWPQKMPEQRLSFSVQETGAVQMNCSFNPIGIDDFLITSPEGNGTLLQASLSENGFSFQRGGLVIRGSENEPPRVLPSFIIDNKCRIWVEVGGTKMEISDWFAENCLL